MDLVYTLIVPAVVKLVQEINLKDWKSVGLILLAALAGAGLGFVEHGVPGIVAGIGQGLSGAGIVTVTGYAVTKAKSTS